MEEQGPRRVEFGRMELAHLSLAVAGAILSTILGMVVAMSIDDPRWSEVVRLAAIAAALFTVLTVGFRLFGESETLRLIKELKNGQDEMRKENRENTRLLVTYLSAIAKALGAKVTLPAESGIDGDGDGKRDANG